MPNKKKAKNKSKSKKQPNLIKVEDIVDKIIQNNKEKLDSINSKEIDFDDISLKNKKGDFLFYIKQKSNEQIKKNSYSKNSKENHNLKKGNNKLKKRPKKSKEKKQNNIKSKNKIIEKTKGKIISPSEKFKSDKTEKNLLDSNKIQENLLPLYSVKDETFIDQKLIEDSKNVDSIKTEETLEKKADKLAIKHGFFKNKKTTKNKKNTEFLSFSKGDLEEFKKKYEENLIFTDLNLVEVEELDEDEIKILDEKLKVFPIIDESYEKEVLTDKVKPKLKKSFFKKRKSVDVDSFNLGQDKIYAGSETENTLVEDKNLKKKVKDKNKRLKFGKSFFKKSEPVKDEIQDLGQDVKSVESDVNKNVIDKESFEPELKEEKKIKKGRLKKSFSKKRKTDDVDKLKLKHKDIIIESEAEKPIVDDKKLKTEIKEKGKIWSFGKEKPKKNFSFLKKKIPKETKQLQKENKKVKLLKKPNLRVNLLPRKNDVVINKKASQDDKIKDSAVVIDTNGKDLKGQSEAFKLASEHLKDTQKPNDDKKTLLDQKEASVNILNSEENAEHEHVFFNEEESSSGGWSPQLSDKAKKALSIPQPIEDGIANDISAQDDIELPKEVLQTKSVKLTDLGFSENEWEELEFYSLYEPFAYVEILREKESLDKCYFLVENALTEEEENLLDFIEETMSSMDIDTEDLENKNESDYLLSRLDEVIHEYSIDIDEESKNKIFYYIGKASLGLGKIDPLMRDPNIEDISCDGAEVPVFLYHRKYGSLKSNIKFDNEDELSAFVFKLAQKCGKHISIAEPMLDATMPDGSRIQMTLSDEITAKGSTFTIRKFRADPFSPPDLVEFNTMSSEMIAFMWIAVENGINTLFAGGTASGKTTALNALTLFIPRESKIVSIEETREINLPHPNWIPGVARSGFGEVVADRVIGEIDMYDLMKAALRQRPEYILVGEIRGREAYVLFQAMATGHATYSTAHADSAQSLIHRLEGKPINIPRVMLQSLDIVCLHVITRVKNIRARRCKQIIEIIDIDPTTKEILTNEVFRWDPVEDKFVYSGKSYILERIRAEKDMTREEMTTEIKNRRSIVEWMNKNNIREFRDVSKLVSQYTESPLETLQMIKKGEKKIDA